MVLCPLSRVLRFSTGVKPYKTTTNSVQNVKSRVHWVKFTRCTFLFSYCTIQPRKTRYLCSVKKQKADPTRPSLIYSGTWLTQAKRYFSRNGCPAMKIGDKFVTAEVNRQGLLEKALTWISFAQGCTIEEYMAKHQHDAECSELWQYFQSVIEWVQMTFIKYRKEMKNVDWGELYARFSSEHYDTNALEQEIAALMVDDDVKKVGIYKYVLTREERWLSIRSFSPSEKRSAYERQKGVCPICHKTFKIEEMEADHIIPWSKGGHTNSDNCQCLCKKCNRDKSNN